MDLSDKFLNDEPITLESFKGIKLSSLLESKSKSALHYSVFNDLIFSYGAT
jgi:hypothetical protein